MYDYEDRLLVGLKLLIISNKLLKLLKLLNSSLKHFGLLPVIRLQSLFEAAF